MYVLRNAKTDFLRCIGYLSFTKDRIKHDLLQTQVLVLQLNFLNYELLASMLSKFMPYDTVRKFMKRQVKICFGLLKLLVRYLINLSREDSMRPL